MFMNHRSTRGLTRRQFLAAMGVLAPASAVYAMRIEPEWLDVLQADVPLLPPDASSPIRVLHISDMHYSPSVSLSYIASAIEAGLEEKPDVIAVTGDFIQDLFPDRDAFIPVLARLAAAAPTYACPGNHDGGQWVYPHGGYRTLDPVADLLEQAGIELLLNRRATVTIRGQSIEIAGLGDLWTEYFSPRDTFNHDSGIHPRIILCHNPDAKARIGMYPWDLMLAGHTHGGQIVIPFLGTPFAPVEDHRYIAGLNRWQNRWIHVTKGIGSYAGIRINCRPDITLLTLTPTSENS